jgi:N-formylglutamate amidohydrolase
MRNVDWYTQWLYDFRDILGNNQIEFNYCSLILEANRDPDKLDDSVPLKDSFNENVYRQGQEPGTAARQSLSLKYLHPFHQKISQNIARGASFMLDRLHNRHRGVQDNKIEFMTTRYWI